jgi:hypothetical protein
MAEKSYVRDFRRDLVQNVEGLYYTYSTNSTRMSISSSELASPPPSAPLGFKWGGGVEGRVTLARG